MTEEDILKLYGKITSNLARMERDMVRKLFQENGDICEGMLVVVSGQEQKFYWDVRITWLKKRDSIEQDRGHLMS